MYSSKFQNQFGIKISLVAIFILLSGCSGLSGLGDLTMDLIECSAGIDCTEKSRETEAQTAAIHSTMRNNTPTYQTSQQTAAAEARIKKTQYEHQSDNDASPANEGSCLSYSSGSNGFTTTVENLCSKALRFTYCWGVARCETSQASSDIAAYGTRSIGRSDDSSASLLLVYAAPKDASYSAYQAGVEKYFAYKKCQGSSCGY